MPISKVIPRFSPPLILVLSLFGIYLFTLAPGLTWANSGSDGGDLLTAAYTGGIPHPTGYPLYLLLARLFQYIPVGSLAYRTNLMSAVGTVCSAFLIYKIVDRALFEQGDKQQWISALAAGYAFGLAPLVWSQAVITEVYALQAFLTTLILYLFTTSVRNVKTEYLERTRGLVLGLAMGNHVTTILMFPMILISGKKVDLGLTKLHPDSSVIRQLVWFSIGLSIYLTLPLRALTNPPVNWGNPITLKRFWWLVSGELYRSYYLQFEFGNIFGYLQAWASLLLQQFGWLGLILGVAGLVLFYTRSRLYFVTIWTSVSYSLFAFIYSPNDFHVYLVPVYISFAIWIGLGTGNLLRRIPFHPAIVAFLGVLLLSGYFAFRVHNYAIDVDASRDLRAEIWGRQVMTDAPNDALIFVKGDRAVFSLWYFHFALEQRSDLVIVAEELLHFDWYQETLRDTYPFLEIPAPFPWPHTIADANPIRPVCHIQFLEQMEIECK